MKTVLLNIWDRLRGSYWFVPAMLGIGAIVASVVAPTLDRTVLQDAFPDWMDTSPSAARAVLSTIASMMFAATGTVFSMTVVTLCLASQQFGPRLLRSFMQDTPTQFTLGIFLSTGLYSLLLLRFSGYATGVDLKLHLSVLLAVCMAVVCIATLIFFVHHVAQLIQAPHIVAAVSDELNSAADRLFPTEGQEERDPVHEDLGALGTGESLFATKEGYVQGISIANIVAIAKESGGVIRFLHRPGAFIVKDTPIAELLNGTSNENLQDNLNANVIVGIRRTPRQDIQCVIGELVEVAVRSLSSGINDPFTARDCIDRLGAVLVRLGRGKMPKWSHCDDQGTLRVIVPLPTFEEILDLSFNQIRRNARNSAEVLLHILKALRLVVANAHRESDLRALKRHVDLVVAQAETSVSDRQAVLEISSVADEIT